MNDRNHERITTLPHEASMWPLEDAQDRAILWNLHTPSGASLISEATLDGWGRDALCRVEVFHVHRIDEHRTVRTKVGWLVEGGDR